MRQGKEVKKDRVIGKTFDAATRKAIVKYPASCKTMVDDETENDVASVPVLTIDPLTEKTGIVDLVTGSVVHETTGAPVASLGSSVSPASLATGSLA